MNVISMLGYVRAFIALGVLIALAYHLRIGATLLLAVALAAVLCDAAKLTGGLPRPDAVDDQVRPLTDVPFIPDAPNDSPATPSVNDDDVYGFPSGHVAVTTAFFLTLALLTGSRRGWMALALAVPLMALSRLYLGRHFPADIVGGLAVGIVATATVVRLRLWRLEHSMRRAPTAWRLLAIGVCAVVLALSVDMPPPYEAGRFLGISCALALIGHRDRFSTLEHGPSSWLRVGLAAATFGIAWWATMTAVQALGLVGSRAGDLLQGSLPMFLVLPAAVWLEPMVRFRPPVAAHS
jgi:membrane-associated phospholipid phosphatase